MVWLLQMRYRYVPVACLIQPARFYKDIMPCDIKDDVRGRGRREQRYSRLVITTLPVSDIHVVAVHL